MVTPARCVRRANTRTQWEMLHAQRALEAMHQRVALRVALANVLLALRVSLQTQEVHAQLAKPARIVPLLDLPNAKTVLQANTTRRRLLHLAPCVRQTLCLKRVRMKGRIANAIKGTAVRTVERAPRAKRAPTQMRLALPSVPTVVLEIMRSAQQAPCAEPAHYIPQL